MWYARAHFGGGGGGTDLRVSGLRVVIPMVVVVADRHGILRRRSRWLLVKRLGLIGLQVVRHEFNREGPADRLGW